MDHPVLKFLKFVHYNLRHHGKIKHNYENFGVKQHETHSHATDHGQNRASCVRLVEEYLMDHPVLKFLKSDY